MVSKTAPSAGPASLLILLPHGWSTLLRELEPGAAALGLAVDGELVEVIADPEDVLGHLRGMRRALRAVAAPTGSEP